MSLVPAPAAPGADFALLAERLRAALGREAVVTDRSELRTYECDGLAHFRAIPAIVVLPVDTAGVAAAVRLCAEAGVPFVARGSGTGLSGGALPRSDGVLIVTSRMRRVRVVDLESERAVLEPGVINLDITRAAAPGGYYYAPDPSSQQVCSIGGNVAENAGGAHCLKYGFTANHVTGVEFVAPDGSVTEIGGAAAEYPGYDLTGAIVGSEGTLGIVTRVTVRLLRAPEAVRTLLAAFATTDEAGAAVSAIIAAGIIPAALEMMDALAIEAAEAAVHCGYPPGAGAVLIAELDGPEAEVVAAFDAVQAFCAAAGAFEIQPATSEAQRALFWKGRKSAFAAVGRISPAYIVQDGVIPRAALPRVLRAISTLAAERGIRVANVFHAGDGNLHPLVLFDDREPGAAERAEAAAGEILGLCIDAGGSITGEHGVGVEKAGFMAQMFAAEDLETMQLLRCAFDPAGRCNPGKIFPTPRLCGERPGVHRGTDSTLGDGLAEVF